MQHRKRMTALLLCAGLVLSLVVSSAFIVCVSGHACSGKRCRTCELVAEKMALLSSFVLLGIAGQVLFMTLPARRPGWVRNADAHEICRTLVGWKVRLND